MTIVAGSRKLWSKDIVEGVIERSGFTITHVIHGDAFGVDKLAGKWAKARGIPVDGIGADWNNLNPEDDLGVPPNPTYNRMLRKWYDHNAGKRRNEEMALLEKQGEKQLIAILQRGLPCRGTRDMMARADKHGLTIYWEEVES